MRSRGWLIGLIVLVALVVVVALCGGRIEHWLLKMHGVHQ